MVNKKEIVLKSDYYNFLKEIKGKIVSARIVAYRRLNKELIKLYWEIGKSIVEKQEKHGWGKGIVEKLAEDLQQEFSAMKGFSVQNLWYMRQFYLAYRDVPDLQQLVGEIPWGQNIIIMSQLKNKEEREFYIRGTVELGWSRNVLVHQIEANAHKQTGIEKMHNFPKALPSHLAEQADNALKDSYLLDFLDVAEPVHERELERKLITNLKDFITELGKGFCFMGSQYPIKLQDKEYYIDLLFFIAICVVWWLLN